MAEPEPRAAAYAAYEDEVGGDDDDDDGSLTQQLQQVHDQFNNAGPARESGSPRPWW